MRVFLGEYVCGGGFAGPASEGLTPSLRSEGAAMLSALVQDVAAVAQTVVPVNPNVWQPPDDVRIDRIAPIDPNKPLWAQWIAAADGCDAAIVVAPESNGILSQGVAMLRAAGVNVIAPSGDFLRVASDKLLTAKALLAAGVNHPLSMALSDRRGEDALSRCDSWVVKPRDGCGTRAIRRVDDFSEAVQHLGENDLLQQWLPGDAISVSLIASAGRQIYLPAVSQRLSQPVLEYSGGCGPLCEEHQRRAMAVASRAIAAMPPTARGFIGLDLLLGSRPNQDAVIEINPRLTTSYVGLRKMTDDNLAARILGLHDAPVACKVGVDEVAWTADGRVEFCDRSVARAPAR